MQNFPVTLVGISILLTFGLCSESNYYRAAVFEHAMVRDMSLAKSEIVKKNLLQYKTAADLAGLHGADIIVFPEWGLFPHDKANRTWLVDLGQDVPDPKKVLTNPCNEPDLFLNRPVLATLSCLAKDNNIFLVANIVDMKECQPIESCDANIIDSCSSDNDCPVDGVLFHNTNIVFNREGTLVARYYKQHLYFEHDMNPIKYPEDTYFETEFGNFTTFVCFDMTFSEAVRAVEEGKVHNVAYPTYWFDHVPMHFATPFQQSWAVTNKVNLLAANTHYPGTGSLGSGIYSSSRGALIYTHSPDGKSKLLISNVPKNPTEDADIPLNLLRFAVDEDKGVEVDIEDNVLFADTCQLDVLGFGQDFEKDYRCHPYDLSQYELRKLTKREDSLEVCSLDFCCSVTYEADSIEEDYYFAVNGNLLDFKGFSFGIESCFLVRCDTHDSKPCSHFLLNSHTIFSKVEIRGKFSTKYIYPFAVDSGIRLTDRSYWSFDRKSKITYHNRDKMSSLSLLGLYGRKYEQDVLIDP